MRHIIRMPLSAPVPMLPPAVDAAHDLDIPDDYAETESLRAVGDRPWYAIAQDHLGVCAVVVFTVGFITGAMLVFGLFQSGR